MASATFGLWQLVILVIVFSHISAAYPSLERHQRQAEAKVADYLGTLRELERTHNLLQSIMNSKRRDPNTPRVRDVFGFADNIPGDGRNAEETCLQIVQKLNARSKDGNFLTIISTEVLESHQRLHVPRFPGNDAEDATRVISRSICQLLAEMNGGAPGAAFGRSHE